MYRVYSNFFLFQVARELAEKTSNQQPNLETGTTARVLVGSAASEPSDVPANQSSSAVGIIASSSHDASANSVPTSAGPSRNVYVPSSSIVGMQNGATSTAIVSVTTKTEVPIVATDAGARRFSQIFTVLSCNLCCLSLFKFLLICCIR